MNGVTSGFCPETAHTPRHIIKSIVAALRRLRIHIIIERLHTHTDSGACGHVKMLTPCTTITLTLYYNLGEYENTVTPNRKR
jgi:hypothetical protein